MNSGVEFSPCYNYRYALWRIWDETLPKVMFIGLNPSTADEKTDDPTIRRCIGFAKDWGYGGIYVLNLFAFRATRPKDLKKSPEPVGEENDTYLRRYTEKTDIIVGAWGIHGKYLNRGSEVRAMFPGMMCLKLTNAGEPGHPLYLPYSCKPISLKIAE